MTTESNEIEGFDQDRIDSIIWKHIGIKPAREIALEAGVKPEYVLRRKNEMIEEIDYLTIQQKRQRFLVEMDSMARDARQRASRTDDEYYAGMINAATGNIKVILNELSRMEKADTSKVESLNQKRIAELVSLVREVVDTSVSEIAARYDLDEQELYDVFNARMVEAAEKRDIS